MSEVVEHTQSRGHEINEIINVQNHVIRESFQNGSVQFSRSVVSNSLQPHELQHARPPCPSPTLGVYSNSCPLSR